MGEIVRDEFVGEHHELTRRVIGVFYDVANELGLGFLESVYRRAMAVALSQAGLMVQEELAIPVIFRGVLLGTYFADIVVEGVLVLELKVGDAITKPFEAQRCITCVILVFGEKAKFKRVVMTNDRKRFKNPTG
jgi:GxxExxY protein